MLQMGNAASPFGLSRQVHDSGHGLGKFWVLSPFPKSN